MFQLFSRLFPYYWKLDADVRHNLWVDSLSAAFFGLLAGAVYPFVSIIAIRLGATDQMIGLLSTAPFFGQMFAIYWGYRSARSVRKVPIIFWSWLISRLLILPLAFTKSPIVFVILVVFHNIIATIAIPAYNGLLKKIYPDRYRGRLMGLVKFLLGLTHVSATYLAGWWIDHLEFKSLFLLAGLAGVISSMIFLSIDEKQRESKVVENQPRAFSIGKIFDIFSRDRAMVWCILGFSIFGFGNLFAYPAYPIYQVKVLKLTSSQIALLSIFNLPVWFLTYPLWGWVHDRTRSMVNIYIGIILYGFTPLIYFFSKSYWMLILASCLQGAAGASQDVGYINQMIKMGGDDVDHYMGIYGTFLGIRGILSPILGSFMISKIGYQGVFLLAALMIFSGLIPMSKVERKMDKIKVNDFTAKS
ncbi:hypothetical protein BBF96_10795 [Anoxybacter fermentans]|uniref:Major facilitator superfamily (MFS) profile domain-containing protein n=1 Tax=Anoxybacter fermentans TaxID=1323375 RepID=A0A3Q9HRS5_9FIRM|nr:MFS transporter [Anoxybacter fermentans]AZR73831.1 hypothetical protein BBF96_10795 [Anoxybacter fermentans]